MPSAVGPLRIFPALLFISIVFPISPARFSRQRLRFPRSSTPRWTEEFWEGLGGGAFQEADGAGAGVVGGAICRRCRAVSTCSPAAHAEQQMPKSRMTFVVQSLSLPLPLPQSLPLPLLQSTATLPVEIFENSAHWKFEKRKSQRKASKLLGKCFLNFTEKLPFFSIQKTRISRNLKIFLEGANVV